MTLPAILSRIGYWDWARALRVPRQSRTGTNSDRRLFITHSPCTFVRYQADDANIDSSDKALQTLVADFLPIHPSAALLQGFGRAVASPTLNIRAGCDLIRMVVVV